MSQPHNFTLGARRNSPARLPVALTDDQIHRIAPSVFANGKHESRSDRYTFIPTIDVLNGPRRQRTRAFWQLAEGMKQIKSGVASPEAVLA